MQSTLIGRAQPSANPAHEHDFGTVRQGATVSHTFLVPVEGDITIARVDLSRPGMNARFSPAAADGRVSVTITWDTTPASGAADGRATVRWSDRTRPPAVLRMTGVVRPVIEMRPPSPALFFSVYRGESSEQTVTIVNREDAPLEVRGLKPDGDHFTASLQTVRPGQEYQIIVRVPPDTQPGRYLEMLVVETSSDIRPQLPLAINVFVKQDVYAFPEEISFGRVDLAVLNRRESLARLLTQTVLVSRRQGPFEIRSVKTDIPALRIRQEPATGASEVFRFDVELDIARLAPGALAGSIRLETSDARFPQLIVPVRGQVR